MIDRASFANNLAQQGYDINQIQSAMETHRTQFGSFKDDLIYNPADFRAAEYVNLYNSEFMNPIEGVFKEDLDKSFVNMYMTSKYGFDEKQTQFKVAQDQDVEQGEEDYSAYAEKTVADYSTMSTTANERPAERYNNSIGGRRKRSAKDTTAVAQGNIQSIRDDLLNIRSFKEGVLGDTVGVRDPLGNIIKLNVFDKGRFGAYNIKYNQEISQATINNDMNRVKELMAENRAIRSKLGVALDESEYNVFQKIISGTAQTASGIMESAAIGLTPFVGAWLVGGYWQQQGAGAVLDAYYADKNINELSEEDIKRANAIAQGIGIPYALVERATAAIPYVRSLGGSAPQKLANALMKKALTDPRASTKIARLGVGAGLQYLTELSEEGVQGVLTDLGVQWTNKEVTDFRRALNEGIRNMADARYALVGLAGGGIVFDARQLSRDIETVGKTKEEIEKANLDITKEEAEQAALVSVGGVLSGSRQARETLDAARLVNQYGIKEDKARDLANDARKAKTNEQIRSSQVSIAREYLRQRFENAYSRFGTGEKIVFPDTVIEGLANQLVDIKTEQDNEAFNIAVQNQIKQFHSLNIRKTLVFRNGFKPSVAKKVADIIINMESMTEEGAIELNTLLQSEFNRLGKESTGDYIYNKFAFLTQQDWADLSNVVSKSPEVVETIIKQQGMDEEAARLFRSAVEGNRDSQSGYNRYVDKKRDDEYARFLVDNKLEDPAFDVKLEEGELKLDKFVLQAEQEILDGELDDQVNRWAEVNSDISKPIEDLRKEYADQLKEYYAKSQAQIDREESREQARSARLEDIKAEADNVRNALSGIASETKIVVHETTEDFEKALGRQDLTAGYDRETDTIHIDAELGSPSVVPHEGFHALVFKVISQVPELENEFKSLLKSVRPNLTASLRSELDEHLKLYDDESYKNEEGLAKALELLAREYKNLPQQQKTLIRQLLDKVMEFLGLGAYADDIYNFGVDFDINNLTRAELQQRAKLLGLKASGTSAELRKRIGGKIPIEDYRIINTLQTLAIKMVEGVEILPQDVNTLRVDLGKLTYRQLQVRAKELKLKSSGTAEQIRQRIIEAFPKLRGSKIENPSDNLNAVASEYDLEDSLRAAKRRNKFDKRIDEIIKDFESKDIPKKPNLASEKAMFSNKLARRLKELQEEFRADLYSPEDVAVYSGRSRTFEVFQLKKRDEDNAIIYTAIINNKLYYFASREVTETKRDKFDNITTRKVKVYFRTDENGVDLEINGEPVGYRGMFEDAHMHKLGYTLEDAHMSLAIQYLQTIDERPTKAETIKDYKREAASSKQDLFGLRGMNRAQVIALGKDERVNAFEKLQQFQIANLTDDQIFRIVNGRMLRLMREATDYEDNRNTYYATVEELGLNPDETTFDEAKKIHEEEADRQSADENFEEDLEDYFFEALERINEYKNKREETGTPRTDSTKVNLDAQQRAFNNEEPNERKRVEFANSQERALNNYDEQNIILIIDEIISSVDPKSPFARGTTDQELIGLTIYRNTIEDKIENLNNEIENLYAVVESGAGGNYAIINTKIREQQSLIATLSRVNKSIDIASSSAGRALRTIANLRLTEDYFRLSSLLVNARRSKNKDRKPEDEQDLTEEEVNKFSEKARSLRKLDKDLRDLQDQVEDAEDARLTGAAYEWYEDKRGKVRPKPTDRYRSAEQIERMKQEMEERRLKRQSILKQLKQMGYEVNLDPYNRSSVVGNKKSNPELYKLIIELAISHIEDGTKDFEDMVNRLRIDLPSLSREDIIAMLSNRTPKKAKKDATQTEETLKNIKKAARLQEEIEDALNGIVKKRKVRQEATPEVKSMRRLLRLYENLVPQIEYDQELTAQIYAKIDRIQRGVEEAFSPRAAERVKSESLRDAERALAEMRQMKKLEQQIDQLERIRSIKDRDEMVSQYEFIFKTLKEKTPKSKELEDLIVKRDTLRNELQKDIEKLQPKDWKYWANEIAGIPRALLATADFSYIFRQGLLVSPSHPKIAAEAATAATKAFFDGSERQAILIDAGIRSHKYYEEAVSLGLELTRFDGRLSGREETFATNLVNRIPLFGRVTKASERHMVTGLNILRSELMFEFLQKQPEASIEAKQAYANYINTATGRASLGDFESAARTLSNLMFSPRFAVSRITVAPQAISNIIKHPELRAELMKQWVSFSLFAGTVYGLAALAMQGDDDDPLEFDPSNPNFGKIRIGNVRFDILAGLGQPARAMLSLAKKADANAMQLIWDEDNVDPIRTIANFVKSKSSPQFGIAYELLFKEDLFTRRDIVYSEEWEEQLMSSILPLSVQNIITAFDEELIGDASVGAKAAAIALEMHGVSVSIYEER